MRHSCPVWRWSELNQGLELAFKDILVWVLFNESDLH